MAPAKTRAVSSPKLKPAVAKQFSIAFGLSSRSCSNAAKDVTITAGWQYFVWSSLLLGPSMQIFSKSYPRTSLASAKISRAPGNFSSFEPIPTYWAPCPGNRITFVSLGSIFGRAAFFDWSRVMYVPATYGSVAQSFTSFASDDLMSSNVAAFSSSSFTFSVPLETGGTFASVPRSRNIRCNLRWNTRNSIV
uniref:Uncharacterized protein n=1 Tax=Anopheles atroparvus TaxID=41427 RepID=A0AAG5D5J5_ANOAO